MYRSNLKKNSPNENVANQLSCFPMVKRKLREGYHRLKYLIRGDKVRCNALSQYIYLSEL